MALSKPVTTKWDVLAPKLPKLSRPLRVAMPCVGIDGCGAALEALGTEYTPCNVYDLDQRYSDYLTGHFKNPADGLFLGPVAGDVTQVALTDLKMPVDLLCSGPPCPPWAGNGNKKGREDKRADVFVAVIKWVVKAIKTGSLIAVVLENVKGILQKVGGQESFMTQLLSVLEQNANEFVWEVKVLNAEHYYLAQSRERVFLRGMRTVFLRNGRELPPVLTPFGKRSFREFLDLSLPSTPRGDLTLPQQANLKGMLAKLKKDKTAGTLDNVEYVVFSVDRAEGKVWKARYHKDICPTLTCNNRYLFVVSVSDLESKSDVGRTCFRFLHPRERFCLQGFKTSVYDAMPSDICAIKAAGNAYPVPLLVANLHGMVKAIHDSAIDLNHWHHEGSGGGDGLFDRLETALQHKGKKEAIKKRPAAAVITKSGKLNTESAKAGTPSTKNAKTGKPNTKSAKKRPAAMNAGAMKKRPATNKQEIKKRTTSTEEPANGWMSDSS